MLSESPTHEKMETSAVNEEVTQENTVVTQATSEDVGSNGDVIQPAVDTNSKGVSEDRSTSSTAGAATSRIQRSDGLDGSSVAQHSSHTRSSSPSVCTDTGTADTCTPSTEPSAYKTSNVHQDTNTDPEIKQPSQCATTNANMDTNVTPTVPTRNSHQDSSNDTAAQSDLTSQSSPCLLEGTVRVYKSEESKLISLELQCQLGQNREYLHQLMQYLKNRLK